MIIANVLGQVGDGISHPVLLFGELDESSVAARNCLGHVCESVLEARVHGAEREDRVRGRSGEDGD